MTGNAPTDEQRPSSSNEVRLIAIAHASSAIPDTAGSVRPAAQTVLILQDERARNRPVTAG